jgi:hypothetical protein
MGQQLGNDFDVTGTVRVSSPEEVQAAVFAVLADVYPGAAFGGLASAFRDFQRMFRGELPGYKGCDTLYHDIQHTLDMTLAMARLIGGHERAEPPAARIGPRRAEVGLIVALFHDSGYILHQDDDVQHGAEYTQTHVSRSSRFLESYIAGIGLGDAAAAAAQIVHFSGYEKTPGEIELPDPKDRVVGELLGTADLMAQMADRCYLEKCRDRLFPEFVLGGLAVREDGDGRTSVRYRSGIDLLRQTPGFFAEVFEKRLDGEYHRRYRYYEAWFEGENPYLDGIEKNLSFLEHVLDGEQWALLRRRPPASASDGVAEQNTHRRAVSRLRQLLAKAGTG